MNEKNTSIVSRRDFLRMGGVLGALASTSGPQVVRAAGPTGKTGEKRPNVLLINVNDLGPEVNSIFQESPVPTPNLERLARSGTAFSLAYCPAPACCPSRTSLQTGVAPWRSGIYYNNHGYRRSKRWIAQVRNLPQHFQDCGYLAAGYGKIFHDRFQDDDTGSWTPNYCVPFSEEKDAALARAALSVCTDFKPYPFGPLPDDWDRDDPAKLQQDTQHANLAIDFLQKPHDRPFFLACGLRRPHVMLFTPKRYFDRFPLDSIAIPDGCRDDDLAGLPKPARWIATHRREFEIITAAGIWKPFLQAYYAAVAYADEQIGRLLAALESSPYRENTIVVFNSDHGWHTGQKHHFSKFALWDLATRVPFIVRVPGCPARQSLDTPVSLLDLYPTLIDLCGLPPPAHSLDGRVLTPILRGVSDERGAPVLNTFGPGNHAVRDRRFYYIRYADGSEELYDMFHDPNQWKNLARQSRYNSVKGSLRGHLPAECAPPAPVTGTDTNAWEPEAFST